jgi:hypothetical protein
MAIDKEYKPLLGEIKQRFVDGEIRKMVWNGEKWLFFADVYPLMYFAQTGNPLVLDDPRELL